MAINVNSEAFCKKAYLNYHCYGNTMGLSPEDMGQITQAWSNKISSWQETVSSDENEYEFDDSEYSKFKEQGYNDAKKNSGHDGSTGGMVTRGVIDGVAGLGGAAVTAFGCGLTKIGGAAVSNAAAKVSEKAAEKMAKVADAGANTSWIVTAPLALAVGAAYLAKRPNKTEKEACDDLQTDMTAAQNALAESQGEMENMSEEIICLSDEANMTNEDTNETLEEKKTEYDMYYNTLMAIQEKIEAGKPLNESEKALYKEVMTYLSEIGVSIEEISEETTEAVDELYDEISTYQEGYDIAAETMGEVEGLTDFAESFDETTRTMCYVEMASQTLNAYSGGQAAARASRFAASGGWVTAWAWAFAAMGTAGAAMSGIGATEQFKWAGEVGNEIELREATQDIHSDTMDIYTEEIDAFDGFMEGVEELELEMPDDIAPPEGEGFPAEGEDPSGIESSEFTDYTAVLTEKEDGKGSKVVTENEDGTGKVVLAKQYGTAITTALGLPDSSSGEKFGEEAIPAIIATLIPGYSPEDILKVMEGGSIESSYDASLIQTQTGEDTGKDTTINNTNTLTENLKSIINFYKPIFVRASLQGWQC